MFKQARAKRGFTLIELLIVIAIILILIAIALPNFLEAQIRAKITKAKAELRTINIAMQAYYLDWKIYPAESEQDVLHRAWSSKGLFWLTTPIKYVASIGDDPFALNTGGNSEYTPFEMGGVEAAATNPCTPCLLTWVVYSAGPSDEREASIRADAPQWQASGAPNPPGGVVNYSSTNGTRSTGVIAQWGGDAWWIGVMLPNASGRKSYNPATHDVGLYVDFVLYLHHMPPSLR